MHFLNRLKYYLIGVGLGILMVMAIFKDRKLTSWTPQNQVIEELTTKTLNYEQFIDCELNCLGLKDTALIRSFLGTADVNFSESKVKDMDNRLYKLLFEDKEVISALVRIKKDELYIEDLELSGIDCECE